MFVTLALAATLSLQTPTRAPLPAGISPALRAFVTTGPGSVPQDGIPEGPSPFVAGGYWARSSSVPGYPNLQNVELHNTGSGYVEKFLFAPAVASATRPAPALIVFHRYSTSHFDALFWTDFLHEARTRNWHFIAPLSAFPSNFGCLEGQINTRAVLEYLNALYPIDTRHLFGVGFSMGAGALATQAARHVDPGDFRFSAIVDHTGSVALADVYANSGQGVRSLLETRFGGNPLQARFRYAQCSVLDYDPSGASQGGADMARNLCATPTLLWMADQDPNAYLRLETRKLRDVLIGYGGQARLTTVAGNQHTWDSLDEHGVCDWLARQPALPLRIRRGTALADADGTWFAFHVEQDTPGKFTPFRWDADPAANRLDFSETVNLRRVRFDARDLDLSYLGDLVIQLSSADGSGDELLLEGIPLSSPPLTVQRNGVPAGYTYDPQAGTLSLPVGAGVGGEWRIHF